ncbi:hypothetical protein N9L68_05445 [bacterium]|nr:hypothetical protein [bacterium]
MSGDWLLACSACAWEMHVGSCWRGSCVLPERLAASLAAVGVDRAAGSATAHCVGGANAAETAATAAAGGRQQQAGNRTLAAGSWREQAGSRQQQAAMGK